MPQSFVFGIDGFGGGIGVFYELLLTEFELNVYQICFATKNSYFCTKIKMNGNKRKTNSPIH